MSKHICVFCSSSNSVAPIFFETAATLGRLIAERDWTLVYGGGNVGLMGALANSVHTHGGKIIGVIPASLRAKAVCYEAADQLIVTDDMRERKGIMDAQADAFLALPGGFGTLEELLEALTGKQLQFHQKPIVLLNVAGFFTPLLAMFDQLYTAKFARLEDQQLYHVTPKLNQAINYIETYRPPQISDKWL